MSHAISSQVTASQIRPPQQRAVQRPLRTSPEITGTARSQAVRSDAQVGDVFEVRNAQTQQSATAGNATQTETAGFLRGLFSLVKPLYSIPAGIVVWVAEKLLIIKAATTTIDVGYHLGRSLKNFTFQHPSILLPLVIPLARLFYAKATVVGVYALLKSSLASIWEAICNMKLSPEAVKGLVGAAATALGVVYCYLYGLSAEFVRDLVCVKRGFFNQDRISQALVFAKLLEEYELTEEKEFVAATDLDDTTPEESVIKALNAKFPHYFVNLAAGAARIRRFRNHSLTRSISDGPNSVTLTKLLSMLNPLLINHEDPSLRDSLRYFNPRTMRRKLKPYVRDLLDLEDMLETDTCPTLPRHISRLLARSDLS